MHAPAQLTKGCAARKGQLETELWASKQLHSCTLALHSSSCPWSDAQHSACCGMRLAKDDRYYAKPESSWAATLAYTLLSPS